MTAPPAPPADVALDAGEDDDHVVDLMRVMGLPTAFSSTKRSHPQPHPPSDVGPPSSPLPPSPGADATVDGRRKKKKTKRGNKASARSTRSVVHVDYYDNPSHVVDGPADAVPPPRATGGAQSVEGGVTLDTKSEESKEQIEGRSTVPIIADAAVEHGSTEDDLTASAPAEGEGWDQLMDEADSDAPSLYPLGYARFADSLDTAAVDDDSAVEDAGADIDADADGDATPSSLPPFGDGEGEEEEEHLDDYGLLQGEVLEGEDCTHHDPIDIDHHYRGLPMGISKRIRLSDEPLPASPSPGVEVDEEGRVKPYPEPEKEVAKELTEPTEGNDAPEELPANVPVPLPSSPPSQPSTAPDIPAFPVPPPLLSLIPGTHPPPSRLPPMSARATHSQVITGIDATSFVPPSTTSHLRGLPRQNRRVVFTDDSPADGVVVEDARVAPPPPHVEREKKAMQEEQSQELPFASPPVPSLQSFIALFPPPPLPHPVDRSASALQADPNMSSAIDLKYFAQRYRLFSLYDRGVRLDATAWFSVTLERIALHQAHRIALAFATSHPPLTVIDAFAGVGGNAIAFARHPRVGRVIAVECDGVRMEMARHNAEVYGVGDKVEWVEGRWEEVRARLMGDVVFLAPPWGGVGYSERYHVSEVDVEGGGAALVEGCREVVGVDGAVALNLPRNVDEAEVVALGGGRPVEVEYNQCNGKCKTITAYFGPLVRREADTSGHWA